MRWLAIFIAFYPLAACSSLQRLTCDSHDIPEISDLMQQACAGDKEAQFTLGDMFERGDGVAKDEKQARRYYEAAATPISGTSYIYVPGVGDVAGYTMPVTTGTPHPGHAGAIYRLGLMLQEGRGGKMDEKRARGYLERAAALGYAQGGGT